MGRQGRLLKNTAILFVGVIGTKLINFIMLPLFTQWLTVEEYGIIDIFTVVVNMLVPVCTLQLEQAVFRFMIDECSIKGQQRVVTTGIAAIGTVLLVLDVPATILFLTLLRDPLYLQILVAVNLHCLYVFLQQVVRGNGKNHHYTVNSVLYALVNTIFSVLLIRFLGLGVGGYIWAFCLAHAGGIGYFLFRAKTGRLIRWSETDTGKLREMLAYSAPMIVNSMSWWVLNASDKLILNLFCGISANGIYAAASKIPGLITTVFNVFSMAWHESTSREKEGDVAGFYSSVFRKLFAVLSYMLVFLLCMCRPMFALLINVQFAEAYEHIPILLVAIFFFCIAQFYGGIYIGAKDSRQLGKTSLIAAVVNLVVNLLFVWQFGIFAASLSTAGAYLVLLGIRFWDVRRLCTIHYNRKECAMVVGMIATACVTAYLAPVHLAVVLFLAFSGVYCVLFRDVLLESLQMVTKKLKYKS